jgi:hypothetical protein
MKEGVIEKVIGFSDKGNTTSILTVPVLVAPVEMNP